MSIPVDFLGKPLIFRIDRPMGSRHPENVFIYPPNNSYMPTVFSADREEPNVYLLRVFEPVEENTGEGIAILHLLDDDNDKLVIVPLG